MGRRRSIVDNLPLPQAEPVPAVQSAAVTEMIEDSTPPATPKRQPKAGIRHTSLYLPAAVDRKLKEIALTNDSNRHDVIMEGIDLVLAKYGTSIAKLSGRK